MNGQKQFKLNKLAFFHWLGRSRAPYLWKLYSWFSILDFIKNLVWSRNLYHANYIENRRKHKCVFLRSFLQSLRFCLIRIFVKVYLGWVHSFISYSPIPDQSDTVHIKPQPGALLQLQTTFHRERYTRYKLTCLDTRRCLESRPSWTDVILHTPCSGWYKDVLLS